jgi:transcriptional regulator with XRE-family HTH domain
MARAVPSTVARSQPSPGAAEPSLGALGIEEAARLVGVSPSAIRLWERQGLVAPLRTRGGMRRYAPADIARLRTVRGWRRVDGLNAAAIRRLLADGDGAHPLPGGPALGGADGGGAGRSESGADGSGVTGRRGAGGPAPIAERLRAIRTAHGLTLRAASERSGLSVSFISALERGLSGASVAALRRLLAAYGTTLGAIVGSTDDGGPGRMVAASARRAVETDAGVRIENLAAASRMLEPHLFVLAPGASSRGPYSHQGEEFMYVLEGRLGVWLDASDESYTLGPGDALTFPSTLEHRFQALGAGETRVIWVNTPPTF